MSHVNLILNHLMRTKVSSLYQLLSHMNEEEIFDSFAGIVNVIASDTGRAVPYHETII